MFKFQRLRHLPGRVSPYSHHALVSGQLGKDGQPSALPLPLGGLGWTGSSKHRARRVGAICPIRCTWSLRSAGVAPAGLTHTGAPSLPQMLGFSFFAATLGKRLTPKPEFPKEKNAFPMCAGWLDLASNIMLQH